MKKIFLLFFLFFFPSLSYSQPSIVFETENHNMGIINQSDKIKYIFEFTNEGDEVLIIEKIVPS